MTKYSKIVLLLLIYAFELTTSCQKDKPLINRTPTSFKEVFDLYWNKMNTNYVYWDIDSTNWDKMYYKYKPIFEELDLNNNSDVIKSVQYFTDMTKELIDGHYFVSFSNQAIISSSLYPALNKKKLNANFHFPYHYYNLDLKYLDANHSLGYDSNNIINGEQLTVLAGTINKEILFFSCTGFSLLKSYKSNNQNTAKQTIQYFFDKLDHLPENTKGIIIDVRGNLGGDLGDLNLFVGRFIDTPLHFGFTQSKYGNGRLDYTPWIKAFINPTSNGLTTKIPIIILADLNSASTSEATIMALKQLPKTIFIGETTWGATGPITDESLYNTGSFKIAEFLTVQTSSCKFKYTDGKIYEGKGFPPDINIPFNSNAINEGRDVQLEKAISLLKQL